MEIPEAAELIEALATSITQNPSQFHFEINITGTRATAIGGGIGLAVQATGSEPGSTTIGYQSSISQPDIDIAQRTADAAVQREMAALAEALNNLASELRSASPDSRRIEGILDSLRRSWVPNVITSIVASIIAKVTIG